MPIQALSSVSIGSDDERAKKQLLDRIQNEVYTKKIDNRNEDSDDDFMALEESSEKERLRSLQEYRDIAEQTREVKLERLIQVNKKFYLGKVELLVLPFKIKLQSSN